VQELDLRRILEAQDEVAVDGILVVSAEGEIVWVNRQYLQMWDVPEATLASGEDAGLVAHAQAKLADAAAFANRLVEIERDGEQLSRDELELLDGRTIERLGGPLRNRDGSLFGRVWFFRDITAFRATERTLRERLEHLQAVYDLAGAVDRAESVEEITRVVFDSLERLLGPNRIALLLADAGGGLRFRAWRGLSDEYRAAIEARSPALPHVENPQPLSIPDATLDPSFADLQEVLRREGLHGYAFIPLQHGDRLIGRIVLYYEEPRELGAAELRLSQALGSHMASAIARREAEEALQLSRDELAVILGGVTDGITVQEPGGRLVYANDAAATLLGVASVHDLVEADPGSILQAFEIYGEDGQPLPVDEFPGRIALAGEVPRERLLRWRARATGVDRWSIVTASPVFGDDGAVRLAINIFRDITERKRAEERVAFLAEAGDVLNRSLDWEATLREVARLAVPRIADWCVVYMRAGDGSIERLAVEHYAGRGEEVRELLARFPIDAAAAVGVPQVVRTGEPLLARETDGDSLARDVEGSGALARELDSLQVCSSMTVPLSTRGEAFGAISFVAAESRRQFEEADLDLALEVARRASTAVENARLYREAEERAQAARVLDAVGDCVFLVDSTGVVRLWNPAAELVTGLAAGDVVGRAAASAIPGWARALPSVPVAEWPEPTRPEAVPLDLGGREIWISISGVGFADGTVYAFRDISEERSVDQLKTDFVSTVSHELRTPLAAIYGASVTLRREELRLPAEQQERLLDVIGSEAERLARTINDILWASRLESDQLQLSIESCDPAELARTVLAAQAAHLPEHLEVELDAAAAPPVVRADPDKLRQVLVNLVENAVKYSPDGGRVTLRVERLGDRVRFAVADGGLGIPHGELDRIFEKFYRLDPQLTRGVGGTGLGLYICRELVRRMGGSIAVRSTLGEGSTFAVDLPAV
jgi:signal transduction histidine kinase